MVLVLAMSASSCSCLQLHGALACMVQISHDEAFNDFLVWTKKLQPLSILAPMVFGGCPGNSHRRLLRQKQPRPAVCKRFWAVSTIQECPCNMVPILILRKPVHAIFAASQLRRQLSLLLWRAMLENALDHPIPKLVTREIQGLRDPSH